MSQIQKRLDQILPRIKNKDFLNCQSQGGEIGFYIFDYEPEHELLIRRYIRYLLKQLDYPGSEVKPIELDLYELMREIIINKKLLGRVPSMEETGGPDKLFQALKPVLKPDNFIELIEKKVQDANLVLITGVGKAWPLVRSHTILNNLHHVIEKVPVVMFFPGTYDQTELRLFKRLKDDNYYRAFKLVEDEVKED